MLVEFQLLAKDRSCLAFRETIGTLFGSIDAATGERFIRELFCLVPKKNNKTTGGAGLMVTALLLNKRPRAEFILTGPTREVAVLAALRVAACAAQPAPEPIIRTVEVVKSVPVPCPAMVERPEFADALLPMSLEILTAAKRAMIAVAERV